MDKSIKLQRTQSILKELLQEALCSLSDTRLNTLSVIDINCSKGKYNAEVFIDCSFLDLKEQKEISILLKKAESILKEYILSSSGWFRCPKLSFKFDESFDKTKRLEEIFKEISKGSSNDRT